MKNKILLVFIFAITASVLPDIIIKEAFGSQPGMLDSLKFGLFIFITIAFLFIKKLRDLSKFTALLALVIIVQILSDHISETSFWKGAFDTNTFTGNVGSNLILKFICIIPIVCLLLIMFKSPKQFYLCKGDLSAKADTIPWLGIRGGVLSWRRVSIISAVLISLGTALLSLLTAPNLSSFSDYDRLLKYLPYIIIFAAANSFCEGVLYRSAVMGTLKDVLPKPYVVLIAAIFFGIPHYYGIPSGIVGAIMASVLGWYMCRSMYETKGFVSSWIIHGMQDAVIFTTMCLFGNLI